MPKAFDISKYAATLNRAAPAEARDIETITAEIIQLQQDAGNAIIGIGKRLIEAKTLIPHGDWLPWLAEEVGYSERVAQSFMRLAREWESNPKALSDLGATKALKLLVLPPEERETFMAESHLVDGEEKSVIDMTSRELDRAIKERDEALKAAAQAQAEQAAAEQARKKMAEDMALANGRMEGLRDEAAAQAERLKAARENAERLEAELRELRARPVDVAVQVDEAAVEAARKEAEAAMRGKLDRAKAAEKKAREDLMELNSALQRAKMEREDALQRLDAMQRAEKRAAMASNEDLVLFRELFERVQEQVNRIHGLLLKARDKDADRAEKMSKALLALAEKVREAAAP